MKSIWLDLFFFTFRAAIVIVNAGGAAHSLATGQHWVGGICIGSAVFQLVREFKRAD